MRFSDYFKALPPEGKKEFAARCKVSLGYLYRVSGGFSSPSLQLCKDIQRESSGAVPLQDWQSEAA